MIEKWSTATILFYEVMAKKEFIFQGFNPKTHQGAVQRLLDCPDIQHVIFSVAFINESGVVLLAPEIKKHAGKVTVFAGIRNDITSRQGLEHLLKIGAKLYVVDTGARHILFHPKIYFARGSKESRLVIGSANFTAGGLNNNIEAGIAFDLDLAVATDKALADSIDGEFEVLFKKYPENIIQVTSEEQLQDFQDSGRLLDEAAVAPPRPVTPASESKADGLPRIKLEVKAIIRSVSRSLLPKSKDKEKPIVAKATDAPAKIETASPISTPELVWTSKPLTESDLTIPSGDNTNQKGAMSLDKGLLADDIDHRHYFREEIFNNLVWETAKVTTVEEAHAKFQLVITGINYGEFNLRIGHTKGTESTTYKQKNAMTRLSWGDAREHITRKDLIGRSVFLYRDAADPGKFMIEID